MKTRKIKMSEALRTQMIAQRQRFIDKFGREPTGDDPVFFDPDADTPQRIDENVMERALIGSMQEAGVHPAIIYAFLKTGRILTDKTYHQIPKDEQEEWDAALREYDELETSQ